SGGVRSCRSNRFAAQSQFAYWLYGRPASLSGLESRASRNRAGRGGVGQSRAQLPARQGHAAGRAFRSRDGCRRTPAGMGLIKAGMGLTGKELTSMNEFQFVVFSNPVAGRETEYNRW